ncbi:Glyoxylase, beta-lactamase superfamily II [Catalinimonas alkaloidigena]|uniref:Glyoxylase, beta-lactamase superfamily II n=1 Tax=Catalinimonas alkaloidigena TaxID=1075417 RepID=A0A1G9K1C4_9BACT|nr:MBL fold metallo-hydrolase [Catalinimonas alkaloidigena]SDL42973.1 Glyoxylase, beta-lactamase superfamily II [Catalinimonas alkaloidigena]
MKQIKPHFYLVENTSASHVYLLQLPDHTILIDTSFPGKTETILMQLQEIGITPDQVTDILLTHHDVDHIGNAKELKELCGATLWAPQLDVPYIQRERKWYGTRRMIELTVRWHAPHVDEIYTEGAKLFDAIQVLSTPGHTPGHVSFLWEEVLIAGDLVMTGSDGKISLLPGFLTWDKGILHKSVRETGALSFQWVCPGHGDPTTRDDKWARILE